MTSTPFNVGLTENTRVSSRVLRPPGGGHTDIFGGGDPEPPRGRRPAPASIYQPTLVEPVKPTNGVAPAAADPPQNGQAAEAQPEQQTLPEPEPRPAAVETPAKPDIIPPEPPKVEAPKRVRVPPGGFSSGLW